MNKSLLKVFEKSLEFIKKDSRCIGGWHFGSISRGLDDELSDVDPVFLIKEEFFEEFPDTIPDIFSHICDKVLLIWPEDFNSHILKNYGILFLENDGILQYDIFLINTAHTDDYFAKIHYTGCDEEDILFDRNGEVRELLLNQEEESIPDRDILQLIDKYWFHFNMIIKYYQRKDIFKILKNLQYIFNTHLEILLSKYQKTDWGGWESLIKYNLPQKNQKELLQYFPSGNIQDINMTLHEVIMLFSKDAKIICEEQGLVYPLEVEQLILDKFRRYVPEIS